MHYIITLTLGLQVALCVEIGGPGHGTYGPAVSLDYKHFPIRKCHCGSNEFWSNTDQLCFPGVTTVDFITNYHPQTIHSVSTVDFSDLFISDVTCDDSSPLQIYNVAFNAPNTIYHAPSGDSFQKFCIEHTQNETRHISMFASVCIPKLEIPSCCPPRNVFDNLSMTCIPMPVEFDPSIHIGATELSGVTLQQYVQEMPTCHMPSITRKILQGDIEHRSGSLHYQQSQIMFFEWENMMGLPIPTTVKFPMDYCVAVEMHGGDTQYAAYIWDEWTKEWCSNTTMASVSLKLSQCDQAMYWVLLPLLILSSFCLVAILMLHALLAELRKSLGSKITICHMASLLAGFLTLVLLHAPVQFNCKIFGPIVQFCFLATFFWLNVMCFDIWLKLRMSSPAADTTIGSRRKFMKYSVYAWGCPLLIGVVTVAMDNAIQQPDYPYLILPGFGQNNCWFADRSATFAYYFGVVAVLMAINVVLFVWVFVILVKANCIYDQVLRHDVRNSKRSWVYFKIFGVMGLTWVFEFLSWQEGTCKYWVVTDIINSLRGLILFIIFFGNKNSLDKIKTKFSSINETLQGNLNKSMNNLRKLSLKPTTNDTGLESYRSDGSSEVSQKLACDPECHDNPGLNVSQSAA